LFFSIHETNGDPSSDLDPEIAKKLAEGDIDPVSLSPMEDINPSFMPRPKSSVTGSKDGARRDKGKGKATSTPKKEAMGILSFFGTAPFRKFR
jgi:exonuclease-1